MASVRSHSQSAVRVLARPAANPESAAHAVRAYYAPAIARIERQVERARERREFADVALAAEREVGAGARAAAVPVLQAARDEAMLHLELRAAWRVLRPYLLALSAYVALASGAARLGVSPGVRTLSALVLGLACVLYGVRMLVGSRDRRWAARALNPAASTSQVWAESRDLLCRAAALIGTGAMLAYVGLTVWVPLLVLAAAAVDLLLELRAARRAFRAYEARYPVEIARFAFGWNGPGTALVGAALDGTPDIDPSQLPGVFRAALADGDVAVHVGPNPAAPVLAFSPRHGLRYHPGTESAGAGGLTGVWQERVATGPAMPHLAALAAQAEGCRPMLAQMAQADEALADAAVELAAIEAQVANWEGLFLPAATMKQILGTLVLVQRGDAAAPSGVLFAGPPGTGKTEIGRRLARLMAGQREGGAAEDGFIFVSAKDLKSEHVGGTEQRVKDLWARVRAAAASGPVVLFVDECDGAFPSRTNPNADQFARSITEGFLSEWQGIEAIAGGPLLVIGATNHQAAIDSAVLSRFGEVITIPAPSADARRGILESTLTRYGVPADALTEAVVRATQGLGGRDLDALVKHAKRDAVAAHDVPGERHVLEAASKLRARTGTAVSARATWDGLVLPAALRTRLQTITGMLRQAELIAKQGVSLPRGMLFYGPPGTGKTEIARTLANEAGLTFIAVSPADIKAGHVGQTAQLVAGAFRKARESSPAILYIDEIDAVAPSRGGGDDDAFTKDLVAQLLQEMDGVTHDPRPVFVLASTNRLDIIDPAVRSRFTDLIEVPLPGVDERARILDVLLRPKPTAPDLARLLPQLAMETDGCSGRDLRSVVERAEQHAVARALAGNTAHAITITADDLRAAIAD